jgi:hypothetical protein
MTNPFLFVLFLPMMPPPAVAPPKGIQWSGFYDGPFVVILTKSQLLAFYNFTTSCPILGYTSNVISALTLQRCEFS